MLIFAKGRGLTRRDWLKGAGGKLRFSDWRLRMTAAVPIGISAVCLRRPYVVHSAIVRCATVDIVAMPLHGCRAALRLVIGRLRMTAAVPIGIRAVCFRRPYVVHRAIVLCATVDIVAMRVAWLPCCTMKLQ